MKGVEKKNIALISFTFQVLLLNKTFIDFLIAFVLSLSTRSSKTASWLFDSLLLFNKIIIGVRDIMVQEVHNINERFEMEFLNFNKIW